MEIGFIYPDLDTDLYVDSVDVWNSDISRDNLKTFLPRAAVFTLNALLLLVWFLLMRGIFALVTRFVTAKSVTVIGLCLFIFLLLIVFSLQGLSVLEKRLRPYLLNKVFKSGDAQESYSFSAYVERKDGGKLVRQEVGFYKMCDTLKRSRIIDAAAVCDGEICRVEVKFENEDESSVYSFGLGYHEADVEKVIVDFTRKCVIFPKEERNDENKENG